MGWSKRACLEGESSQGEAVGCSLTGVGKAEGVYLVVFSAITCLIPRPVVISETRVGERAQPVSRPERELRGRSLGKECGFSLQFEFRNWAETAS